MRQTVVSKMMKRCKKIIFEQEKPKVLDLTRKYPLRGYILGVLTHTTALDQLWGNDESLKCGIVICLGESILTW